VHAIVELFVPIHEKTKPFDYYEERNLISNVFKEKKYIDLYVYIINNIYLWL